MKICLAVFALLVTFGCASAPDPICKTEEGSSEKQCSQRPTRHQMMNQRSVI